MVDKYLLRKVISIESTDFSFLYKGKCKRGGKSIARCKPERRLRWSWARGSFRLPTQSSCKSKSPFVGSRPALPCLLHFSDLNQQWILSQRSWKVVAYSEHLVSGGDQKIKKTLDKCTLTPCQQQVEENWPEWLLIARKTRCLGWQGRWLPPTVWRGERHLEMWAFPTIILASLSINIFKVLSGLNVYPHMFCC